MDEKAQNLLRVARGLLGEVLTQEVLGEADDALKAAGNGDHFLTVHLPSAVTELEEDQLAMGTLIYGTRCVDAEFAGIIGGSRKTRLGWATVRLVAVSYHDNDGRRVTVSTT